MDGTFSFYDDLNINTYWARTATAGVEDELSYRAQLDYAGDRYQPVEEVCLLELAYSGSLAMSD